MTMLHRFRVILGVFVILAGAIELKAAKEDDDTLGFDWHKGPYAASLRSVARLQVPEGYRFLDHKDTRRWLERHGNEGDKSAIGLIQNTKDGWVAIFEFDDIGYVKDDEKNKLDSMADELLDGYRKGAEQQNRRRKDSGIPDIQVLGWQVRPNYNDATKNLEWCVLAESGGQKFVNHNVRILGRRGVTRVTLIEDQEKLDETLPVFRNILKTFGYSTGESYAEFRQGDKIAKYGLGALVAGGAAAAAYKVGLLGPLIGFFKKGFKFVILAIAALAAAIRNFFGKLFGKNRGTDREQLR